MEGFLPIGALMAWKAFFATGRWDPVHPAAMVIIGFAVITSLFLRKAFCGWFCPVGTLSEWLWKWGARLFGRNCRIPAWMDIPLRSVKYMLLGFFLWVIFSMDTVALLHFLNSPYYKMADVKMLFFFTRMSAVTAVVLMVLILSSLVVRNPWCRYFCPYGALMGLLALWSPTRIRRRPETCTRCQRCSEICPYHLPVHQRLQIRSAECNGCMECTMVCPVQGTLELKTRGLGRRTWNQVRLGLVVVIFFLGAVYTAKITGHWRSSVTEQEFRIRLMQVESSAYTHPSVSRGGGGRYLPGS